MKYTQVRDILEPFTYFRFDLQCICNMRDKFSLFERYTSRRKLHEIAYCVCLCLPANMSRLISGGCFGKGVCEN